MSKEQCTVETMYDQLAKLVEPGVRDGEQRVPGIYSYYDKDTTRGIHRRHESIEKDVLDFSVRKGKIRIELEKGCFHVWPEWDAGRGICAIKTDADRSFESLEEVSSCLLRLAGLDDDNLSLT